MKDLYARLDEILTGDAKLRSLTGYKQIKDVPIGKEGTQTGISEYTIRRGFQTEGNWKRLVAYYFQPEIIIQDFSPNIRELPLVVVIYDRISDLNLYDISERVIELLDNENVVMKLNVDGKVHAYDCSYSGQIQSPTYDSDLKSYRMSIRFSVIARKESNNG